MARYKLLKDLRSNAALSDRSIIRDEAFRIFFENRGDDGFSECWWNGTSII